MHAHLSVFPGEKKPGLADAREIAICGEKKAPAYEMWHYTGPRRPEVI